MASAINEKTLENLEELARLKIKPARAAKLLKDLEKILNYFEELKKLKMENVLPTRPPSTSSMAKSGAVTGGTLSKNVFREEKANGKVLNGSAATAQFPEKQNSFLKIPPVFSGEDGE